MRVECVSPKRVDGTPAGNGSGITIGREYLVLGMVVAPGKETLFHMVRDDGTLVYLRADQFAMCDPRAPREWRHVTHGTSVTISYPALLQPGILERFFDGDQAATAEIGELVAGVHYEGGMPRPDLWTY